MYGSSHRSSRIPPSHIAAGLVLLLLAAYLLSAAFSNGSPAVSAPIVAHTESHLEIPSGTPVKIIPVDIAKLPAPQVTPMSIAVTPTPNPIPRVPRTAEQEAVRNLLNSQGGVYGFVLLDASGEVIAAYNSLTPFVTASTYKLVLMADILRRVEADEIGLWDDVYLDPVAFDVNGGDNYYNWQVAGTYTTVENLLYAVGAYSSNVAAHTLLSLTDADALNTTAFSIGMIRTCLLCDPYSQPFWPPEPGIDSSAEDIDLAMRYIGVEAELGPVNLTTPYDMATYMRAMIDDTLVSPWVSQKVFEILSQQAIRDRLPVYNWDVTVVNKPGNLAGVVNDVGALYLPGGARAVAALSINVPDDVYATEIIQLLGLIANGTTDWS